ncbi:MAG: hypothetical protein M3176_12870 [Chloroflexota bacterium]|nr:hypothetical protein [Chloroflexota bacterium]
MSRQAAIRVEQLVTEVAARRPDHPALIFGERRTRLSSLRSPVAGPTLSSAISHQRRRPRKLWQSLARPD